jgi:phosphatidylglycerol:prolipoprotein diacylglycerol transferase
VQLYESFCNFLLFSLLYRLSQRKHRPGQIIGLYLVIYSTVRFCVEFFRNHEQSLILNLSLTQWISLGLLALGAVILATVKSPSVSAPTQSPKSQVA